MSKTFMTCRDCGIRKEITRLSLRCDSCWERLKLAERVERFKLKDD